MVTQTLPDLMTSKQTAQLILGIRARVNFMFYVSVCVCVGVFESIALCVNNTWQNRGTKWVEPKVFILVLYLLVACVKQSNYTSIICVISAPHPKVNQNILI